MVDPETPKIGPFKFASELTAHAASDPALRRHRLSKDILATLADGAARTGSCYRSIGKLAERFETQPNSIRRSLRALAALGYIRMEIPPGRVVYTFHLPIDPALRAPRKEAEPRGQRAPAPAPRPRDYGTPSPTNRLDAWKDEPNPAPPWNRPSHGYKGPTNLIVSPHRPPSDFGVHEAPSDFGVHERGGSFGVHEAAPTSGYMGVPPVNRNEPEGNRILNPGDPEFRSAFLTSDARPSEAPAPTQTPSSRPAPSPAATSHPPRPEAPVLTLTEIRTVDALATALVDPRPQTVATAANLMGTVLDGHGRYVGGLRQLLWDGSKLGDSAQADILDRFTKVLANPKGRGRRFLREVRPIVPRRGEAPAKAAPVPPGDPPRPASPPSAAEDERLASWRKQWPEMPEDRRWLYLNKGVVPAELVHEFRRGMGRASA